MEHLAAVDAFWQSVAKNEEDGRKKIIDSVRKFA